MAAEAGAGGSGASKRRPSSLLGDTPIQPRAAALRASLSEKISAVSHGSVGHSGVSVGGEPGTGADALGGGVAGSAAGVSPLGGLVERVRAFATERPEVVVGGAFAGGLVLATILKRLAR